MEPLATRPKGNYMLEADWASLYALTKHWISDLTFYGDDLKFVHHLLNKFYVWIFDEERTHEGAEIGKKLELMNLRHEALFLQTQEHLSHLSDLIEDPFKYDAHIFRAEHAVLEEEIAHFVKDFRDCKKDTLELTKHSVGSEAFMDQLNA